MTATLRNPVDKLNVTAGELLQYQVKPRDQICGVVVGAKNCQKATQLLRLRRSKKHVTNPRITMSTNVDVTIITNREVVESNNRLNFTFQLEFVSSSFSLINQDFVSKSFNNQEFFFAVHCSS